MTIENGFESRLPLQTNSLIPMATISRNAAVQVYLRDLGLACIEASGRPELIPLLVALLLLAPRTTEVAQIPRQRAQRPSEREP